MPNRCDPPLSLATASQVHPPFTVPQVKAFFQDCLEDENDKQASKPEVVEAVAAGKSSKYISLTLSLFSKVFAATLFTIRAAFAHGMLVSCKGVTDVLKLTLILLGGLGTHTPFHLDYTQALNVAFSVGGSSSDVLAVWVCIAPFAIHTADTWIKQQKKNKKAFIFPQGFATKGKVFLARPLLDTFIYEMNANIPNSVVIVPQRHGQVVYVPPGWIHQVTNLQPCLKVAFDYYDPKHFGVYALVHELASKYFKLNMSIDYAFFNLMMEDLLEKQL